MSLSLTMGHPTLAPDITHFREPIPKPNYLPHPWTHPTYHPEPHPHPISRFAIMHRTVRLTDGWRECSMTIHVGRFCSRHVRHARFPRDKLATFSWPIRGYEDAMRRLLPWYLGYSQQSFIYTLKYLVSERFRNWRFCSHITRDSGSRRCRRKRSCSAMHSGIFSLHYVCGPGARERERERDSGGLVRSAVTASISGYWSIGCRSGFSHPVVTRRAVFTSGITTPPAGPHQQHV